MVGLKHMFITLVQMRRVYYNYWGNVKNKTPRIYFLQHCSDY